MYASQKVVLLFLRSLADPGPAGSDHVRGEGDSPGVGDVPHERARVGLAGGGGRQEDVLVEAERADAVVPHRGRGGGAREPRDQQQVRR